MVHACSCSVVAAGLERALATIQGEVGKAGKNYIVQHVNFDVTTAGYLCYVVVDVYSPKEGGEGKNSCLRVAR